jgi:peroxiredoxin
MAIVEAGELGRQLQQINERVPLPVADRVTAAIRELEVSGAAPGLAIGDEAPEFTLPDALGRPVSLGERVASGPVVLVFYRGEWCPYCNTHLRALQAALPDIRALGASLFAVSPQSPDHSLSMTEKAELAFEVLSDADQKVIRAYKVQFTAPTDLQDLHLNIFHNDLRTHAADGSWNLPVPATFVIDRAGIVRAAHVSPDYRTRMEPADIITALTRLA